MKNITSIIMSMYNGKKHIIEVIDNLFFPSILNNASSDKELTIIDDFSSLKKETKAVVDKYLPDLRKKFGNVIFERNEKNYGFGKSYNRGINLAEGKNLIVTNDDIYFPLGSIDSLVDTLSENENYGLVGPITNEKSVFTYQYCKQAPIIKDYSKKEIKLIETFSDFVKRLMKDQRIVTDSISGFCFATKSEVIKEIGDFDEIFGYGLCEDADFSKRVNQQYSLIINPEIFVYHGGIGGKTASSLMQHPIKTAYTYIINLFKYANKWHDYKGTLKQVGEGMYRSKTGKRTVSELFEKLYNQ